MPISGPRILVFGASGRYAGLLIPELVARGAIVRGLIRNPDKRSQVEKRGAAEIVVAELHDRASLDAAMRDVDGVFYIAPVYPGDESQQVGISFVGAAKMAGVKRIVFSSVIHPVLAKLDNHIQKVPVEAAIIESGLTFTILHPAHFYQNMAAFWPGVLKDGVFIEPYSTTKRLSHVDYRDVAEVAAIAFTEDRLVNGTFELCADHGLNRVEVAAVMSEVLGRPIRAEALDLDTWRARSKADDYTKQALARMFNFYNSYGLIGNPLILNAILGRKPRSLHQFFSDLQAGNQTTAQ